jgi:hypothetical protein
MPYRELLEKHSDGSVPMEAFPINGRERFNAKLARTNVSRGLTTGFASAIVVNCIVASGTVLTAENGGMSFIIVFGDGTSTGGATGVISCPAVTADPGFTINSYQVIASADFTASLVTPVPTTVTMFYTLVGGGQNGVTSPTATINNGPGINSNPSVRPARSTSVRT